MARTELPQHGRRMDQARARSAWELGDPSWADMIVEAYLDPERDSRELHQDMAEPPGRPEQMGRRVTCVPMVLGDGTVALVRGAFTEEEIVAHREAAREVVRRRAHDGGPEHPGGE